MPERSVVVTPAILRTLTSAVVRQALLQPRTFVVLAVAAVVVVLEAVLTLGPAGSAGPAAAVVLAVGIILLVVALVVGSVRFRTGRSLATVLPVGSTLTASVDADGLRVETPRGSGTTRWEAFRSVRIRPDAVVLQQTSRIVVALPGVLFDDRDRALLQSRVGAVTAP